MTTFYRIIGLFFGLAGLLLVPFGHLSPEAENLSGRSDLLRVEVKSVWRSPHPRQTNVNVVFLKDPKTERLLPIWIGRFEADAIQMKLEGQTFPRPLTHDLLKSLIEATGAKLEYILIDALRAMDGRNSGTFFAKIALTRSDKTPVEIDSRTSDAIALSMRTGTPVYVTSGIMEGNSIGSERELMEMRKSHLKPQASEKADKKPGNTYY